MIQTRPFAEAKSKVRERNTMPLEIPEGPDMFDQLLYVRLRERDTDIDIAQRDSAMPRKPYA